MPRPELPYIAATGIAVSAATYRDGHLPTLGPSVIAVIVLILVTSMTDGTKIAPLVRAFGMLVLLTTVIAAGNVYINKRKRGKTT